MDYESEAKNNKQAFETVLKANEDMWRVYQAMQKIVEFGGNGSVEIHIVKGRLKTNKGLYIKPGWEE